MYHLAVNRVQTGPFSEAEVRQRLAAGEVHGDALCWREGWEKWRKVSEVFPGAEPPAMPAPPPLPTTAAVPPLPMGRATTQTSGLAVASLICGICSLVIFPLFFLFAPTAVVLGHVAQSKIKRSNGTIVGGGLALGGLLLGYIVGLLMLLLVAAIAIPAYQKVRQHSQDQAVRNNLTQIWYAAEQQMLETGAETVSYEELVGPEKSLQEESLQPVAGEDYRSLVIRRGDHSISVTLSTGRSVVYYSNNPAGGDVPEEEPRMDSDTSEENATEPAEAPESVAPATEPEALAGRPVFA